MISRIAKRDKTLFNTIHLFAVKGLQVLQNNTNYNIVLIIQYNSHLFAQNKMVLCRENDKIFLFDQYDTWPFDGVNPVLGIWEM